MSYTASPANNSQRLSVSDATLKCGRVIAPILASLLVACGEKPPTD